jgi:hypothetical protein
MGKHPLYNETGLQKNNKSHVLYALANKQMELKQIQDEYEAKISKIKSDLRAMEQVICIFDSNCSETLDKINSKPIRKNKPRLFRNNELRTLVIKNIKESEKPITNRELGEIIKKLKNIDVEIDITTNVKDCTKVLSSRGLIKNVSEFDGQCGYVIA